MQLLRGEVDRFRRLAVYVHDGFSAYRQRGYEYGCCEDIGARICNSNHNFHAFGEYRTSDLSDNIFYC